ncbi:hypothetical protein J9B83_06675 [Marinomonas sp. A79]|uniref:Bacterial virulence factor hemolysin n=1 Tax=Marinomonas vulgaris TaxID=2823372 RepID=A0ABS5HCF7_9GAMM|nr:AhpA/YtjB family protein [Marinomonas vulgaris]MBR7888624.1 hypothetical protein [Marinomonas vulgaris]
MNIQSKKKAITAYLRSKISATVVMVATFISLMILTVCLFWYTMTHALGNYLNQQTEVLGSSLATQAAFNATQSILNNDLLSLNVLLNRLVVDDNILSARVYNKKDELLAEADSSQSGVRTEQSYRPDDKRRIYSSSIKFRDEIVGHVLITLDKTPAQATLQHLNNLLIGLAIFVCALALLIIILLTKWLFTPISDATSVLEAFGKGKSASLFSPARYTEVKSLFNAVETIQSLPLPIDESKVSATEEASIAATKPQFEINFDAIFEESRQRSCVLYFDILNVEDWHKDMTPLQVSNLLTPIYRAMFQASEIYLGQVHQYKNDAAVVLFSAHHCDDNLYLNAVSTAQLFLGLIDKLLENELYKDAPTLNFHLGLHQGNAQITTMVKEEYFNADEITPLLKEIEQLSHSESVNKLVITDDIFTLPHIQNRVFTGLPEFIEDGDNEILAYEVKGMSDKYKQQIHRHIVDIIHPEEEADALI